MKLPLTIGASIDMVYKIQNDLKEKKNTLFKTKEYSSVIEAENIAEEAKNLLLSTFGEEKLHLAAGCIGQTKIEARRKFKVSDVDKLQEYIKENDTFKTIPAVIKHINSGEHIPGLIDYIEIELIVEEALNANTK